MTAEKEVEERKFGLTQHNEMLLEPLTYPQVI
jgi:hypothetical protein